MALEFELTERGKKAAKHGICLKMGDDYVNIGGEEIEVTIKETPSRPEHKRKYVAATQKHLKAYFELGGHRIVQKVSKKSKAKTEAVENISENGKDK